MNVSDRGCSPLEVSSKILVDSDQVQFPLASVVHHMKPKLIYAFEFSVVLLVAATNPCMHMGSEHFWLELNPVYEGCVQTTEVGGLYSRYKTGGQATISKCFC